MPAVDTEHRTDDKPAAADDGRTIEAIDTDTKDTQLDDHEQKDTKAEKFERRVSKAPRQLSISLRAAAFGSVVCILAATAGVFAWLYWGAHDELAAQHRATNDRNHAEEIATDYAVNAAEMDFQDFNGWKLKLINGTSPELKDKLTKAADSMQQILGPLQWKSTARPLAAIVRSDNGGVYVVDSFVSVLTKTVQAPEGLQSTATYSITLDSKHNWQITDVGGIDAALRK